jgi:chromosome segregation ATPase
MSLHSDKARPPEQTDGPTPLEPTEADDSAIGDRHSRAASRSLEAQIHVASLEGQVDLLVDERDDLEREVGRLEDAVDRLESEVETLEDALDRKDAELDGMRRRYEQVLAGKDRANRDLREERADAPTVRSRVGAVVSWLAGLLPGR